VNPKSSISLTNIPQNSLQGSLTDLRSSDAAVTISPLNPTGNDPRDTEATVSQFDDVRNYMGGIETRGSTAVMFDRRRSRGSTVNDSRRGSSENEISSSDIAKATASFDRGVRLTEGQLTYKLKIMFGFLQILTNLSTVQGIPWPNMYVTFMSYFNVVNLDFIPWNSLGCVATFDYYVKFLFTVSLPFAMVLALGLLYLLPMYIMDIRDVSDHGKFRKKNKQAQKQFTKLGLFTAFVIYPTLSRTIFSILDCRSVAGKVYLNADFTLECYTSTHTTFLALSVIMIVIYPVGIPVACFLLVRRYRKDLLNPSVRMQYGFLYAAYNVTYWYYELLDMGHKLILTSLIVFLPSEFRIIVSMIVVMGYCVLILFFRPYLRKGDDNLHLFVQVALFNICLMSRVMQHLDAVYIDPLLDTMLSLYMIATVCLIAAGFFIMTCRNATKMVQNWRKKRILKREGFDEHTLQSMCTDQVVNKADRKNFDNASVFVKTSQCF